VDDFALCVASKQAVLGNQTRNRDKTNASKYSENENISNYKHISRSLTEIDLEKLSIQSPEGRARETIQLCNSWTSHLALIFRMPMRLPLFEEPILLRF
jgi:hypothetical protein